MSEFFLFHILKSSGLSNINSDMYGRPKTITFPGQAPRVRYSSQNVNQTIIREELRENNVPISFNTAAIYEYMLDQLTVTRDEGSKKKKGIDPELAKEYATILKQKTSPKKEAKTASPDDANDDAEKKEKKEKNIVTKFSTEEFGMINDLIERIRNGYKPKEEDFEICGKIPDMDMILFGTMNASHPERDISGGWFQNHPFTVTEAIIETDQFCAKDDLRKTKGAAFLSDKFFSNGTFYMFGVADMGLLVKNVLIGKEDNKKNREAARQQVLSTLQIILNGLVRRTPPGRAKKNADSYAYADYVMIEKGTTQPRSFSSAFNEKIVGDVRKEAINRIRTCHAAYNAMEETDIPFVEFELGESREKFQELHSFLQ